MTLVQPAPCCSASTSARCGTGSSSRFTRTRGFPHRCAGYPRAPSATRPEGEPKVSSKTSVSASTVPTRLRAGGGQRKWVSKPAKAAMILFARAGAAVTVVLLVKSRGTDDAQEVILVPFAIYWTVVTVTLIWMTDGFVRAVRRASRRSAPRARRECPRREGLAPRVTWTRSRGTNPRASSSGLLRHEGSASRRWDGRPDAREGRRARKTKPRARDRDPRRAAPRARRPGAGRPRLGESDRLGSRHCGPPAPVGGGT